MRHPKPSHRSICGPPALFRAARRSRVLEGNACHAAKRLSGYSSAPLDDEHGLIVNTVLFANLAETIVFFHRIFQQSVADFLCRLAIALTHHPFKLLTFFFVAAVVDSIGIE